MFRLGGGGRLLRLIVRRIVQDCRQRLQAEVRIMRVRIQPIGNVVAASLDVAERRDVHHLHARGRAGHRPRHRRRVRQAGRVRVWNHHHPRRAGQVRRVARRPCRAPAGGARPARVAGGAAGERRQAVRVFLARHHHHHHHQVLVLDRPLYGREGGDQAPAGWREPFACPDASRPSVDRMSSNEQPCDHAIHGGPSSGRDPIQTRSVPPQHGHGPVMPSPARVVVGWNPARREAATIVAPVQGVMRGAPSCGAVSPRAARDIAGVRRVQPLLGLRSTPTGRLRHPERLSGNAGSRRVCVRASGGTVLGSAPGAGS